MDMYIQTTVSFLLLSHQRVLIPDADADPVRYFRPFCFPFINVSSSSIQRVPTLPTRIPTSVIRPLGPHGLLRRRVSRWNLRSACWPVDAGNVILLSATIALFFVFFEELDVAF
jgi:hypothetical protein